MNVEEFADNLEAACSQATEAADDQPGRYGGRYVARLNDTEFCVLKDDDPDCPGISDMDIYAHVQPHAVHAIGRVRNYLSTEGKVDRDYFYCS